jgi:hypothetical protein
MLPASSGVKCEVSHFKPKGRGAACSSKTVASTYKNANCHNPKDYNLNSHHCENLTSFMKLEEA